MSGRSNESADGSNDDLLADSEAYYARREVAWLTVLGIVLIVIGGAGTWLSRWETVEFREVDVIDDRVISVGYECNTASRFEIEEFHDRVEIVLTQRPPENNQDCYNARCARLSEPLGDRRVINGGTGDEVRTVENRDRGRCVDGFFAFNQ